MANENYICIHVHSSVLRLQEHTLNLTFQVPQGINNYTMLKAYPMYHSNVTESIPTWLSYIYKGN